MFVPRDPLDPFGDSGGPCDPGRAPVGDVGTAMFFIDSQLKTLEDDAEEPDTEHRRLTDNVLRSFDAASASDVLDGACTLVYLFMQWLRQVHETNDHDVVEHVVPYVVGTLRKMTRSIRPESIPTMAGLMIASAIGQSPTLWRAQYGPWQQMEMTALEATTLLLARYINDLADDRDAATRMIMELLSSAEDA